MIKSFREIRFFQKWMQKNQRKLSFFNLPYLIKKIKLLFLINLELSFYSTILLINFHIFFTFFQVLDSKHFLKLNYKINFILNHLDIFPIYFKIKF